MWTTSKHFCGGVCTCHLIVFENKNFFVWQQGLRIKGHWKGYQLYIHTVPFDYSNVFIFNETWHKKVKVEFQDKCSKL